MATATADPNRLNRKLYDASPAAARQAQNAGVDEAHQLADRLRSEAASIADEHEVDEALVFAVLVRSLTSTLLANHPVAR